MELVIDHVPGSGRAVACTLDGRRAGNLVYRIATGSDSPVWNLTSTVVDPAFAGRGVGSALVRAVVVDACEVSATIVPTCWFVDGWLQRHPDYAHLLPDDLH